MMGWDNRCYHCGSDKHRRNECKSCEEMMKKANVGKPKADWKPPQGYKSALGKARDEAKAKAKKVNSMTDLENENDSASEDDDTYSQVGQSFSIQA